MTVTVFTYYSNNLTTLEYDYVLLSLCIINSYATQIWSTISNMQLDGLQWQTVDCYTFTRKVHFWTGHFWPHLDSLWCWFL